MVPWLSKVPTRPAHGIQGTRQSDSAAACLSRQNSTRMGVIRGTAQIWSADGLEMIGVAACNLHLRGAMPVGGTLIWPAGLVQEPTVSGSYQLRLDGRLLVVTCVGFVRTEGGLGVAVMRFTT